MLISEMEAVALAPYLTSAAIAPDLLPAVRSQLFCVLNEAPDEVAYLKLALQEGRIDGLIYSGPCACLIGTIANARGCSPYNMDSYLAYDPSRPIERWFSEIAPFQVPGTNPVVDVTLRWIEEWQARQWPAADKDVSA